jgi:RNA polymerase sigma-70 factor (ECF subfamily)
MPAEIVRLDVVVEAARAGSPHAWAELVTRFQDVAVATALGCSGEIESARDIAQEAFVLAFRHLRELEDTGAFPAWFLRLVRTACHRRRRRLSVVTLPLDRVAAGDGADPAHIVLSQREAERVRSAVEALPQAERVVVALHYLAGLTYPEVATFLGIGLSATKKRAHVARRRLKELLPMTADHLSTARPSRSGRFRDTVLLFAAIRDRDHASVRQLLARDPGLVTAEEDWTREEAFAANLPYAAHATPLVRAAGAGDIELVRLLLEAGSDPDGACGCGGGETPLWAATVVGATDVVAELLGRGAGPDAAAFHGATPLHVAVQRRRADIERLLDAAGANRQLTDAGGRTPEDWATRDREDDHEAPPGLLLTGIRALDLFAPIGRGTVQRWAAGHGLGQLVVLVAVVDALSHLDCWFVGFEQDLVGAAELEHALAELGATGTIRLVARGTEPALARERFARTIGDACDVRGTPRLMVCLEARGHAHDVALALTRLRAAAGVAATLVVDPVTELTARMPAGPPEGYDAQVAFDHIRAARRLYPAVDPAATVARSYPSDAHTDLVARARSLLVDYLATDPELRLPEMADRRRRRAQRLIRLLAQPLTVAEPFTSVPGQRTPYDVLLEEVRQALSTA